MNPQECEQLDRFLNQLCDARVIEKNPEADALIRNAVARQPDAAYLLVQRAMLVEQALNAAKAQIARLQSELRSSQSNGRDKFLAGANPWSQPRDNAPVPSPGASTNFQTSRQALPASAGSSGGTSFLGNIATTAAGVVAGSFLFQGIENLLGHHQSPASWAGPTGEHLSEQTTINNYYAADQANDWRQQEDDNSFMASDSDDSLTDDGDNSTWV